MKTLISLVLILTATLSISQTKYSDANLNFDIDAIFNKITIKPKPGSDLNNYKIQIIDSKKNVVKSVDLSKMATQKENTIAILDLVSGNYTCLIYKEKEEVYKADFFKDAMYAEPQSAPVLYNSPN